MTLLLKGHDGTTYNLEGWRGYNTYIISSVPGVRTKVGLRVTWDLDKWVTILEMTVPTDKDRVTHAKNTLETHFLLHAMPEVKNENNRGT